MREEIKVSQKVKDDYEEWIRTTRQWAEAAIKSQYIAGGYSVICLDNISYDVLYEDGTHFRVLAPINSEGSPAIIILHDGTQIDLSPFHTWRVRPIMNADSTGSIGIGFLSSDEMLPVIKVLTRKQFDAVYLALMRASIIKGKHGDLIENENASLLTVKDNEIISIH